MRTIFAVCLFVGALFAVNYISMPWYAAVAGIVASGLLAWRLCLCRHPGPLAFYPAVSPDPPRWHCVDCGKTWPANFTRDTTPVQKFTGHDESKSKQAAKRAAELDERKKSLALQRAGLR